MSKELGKETEQCRLTLTNIPISWNCGTKFQRIIEVSDPISADSAHSLGWTSAAKGRVTLRTTSTCSQSVHSTSSVEDDIEDEGDIDMGSFANVTLVTKKNNVEWVGQDATGEIGIVQGVNLRFQGPDDTCNGDLQGWAVRSGHPLSCHDTGRSICYYEITILDGGPRKYVSP